MTDTGIEQATAAYLDSVRAALADLPASEVGEILDDVGPHVTEVATEITADDGNDGDLADRLRERLGSPQEYAAELRAAAGYPPRVVTAPVPARSGVPRARLACWLLGLSVLLALTLPLSVAGSDAEAAFVMLLLAGACAVVSFLVMVGDPDGVAGVARLPEVRWLVERNPGGAVAEYAKLFQPGWWLLRAVIAAVLVVLVFSGGVATGLAAVILAVPLAIGSAWLGRRSQVDRRWLWAVLPLNTFALALGLIFLGEMSYRSGGYYGGSGEVAPQVPPFGNVYPYDSTGEPLTGVFLYDENGQPITAGYWYTECAPVTQLPMPANQFPQPEYEYDPDSGDCVLRSVAPTPSRLPSGSGSPSSTVTPPQATSGTPDGTTPTPVTSTPVVTPTPTS